MANSRPKVEVLLVSADQTTLALMESWIKKAGYRVATCSSFHDARNFLARRVPRVLATDIRLGPFNGLQLVLLAQQQEPAVQAIVIAEFDDPVLRKVALQAGAAYLIKPVPEELLNKIAPSRLDE